MSCYVISCHVMLYHVMLCYIMSCYVILCHVMLYHVMLCYIMLLAEWTQCCWDIKKYRLIDPSWPWHYTLLAFHPPLLPTCCRWPRCQCWWPHNQIHNQIHNQNQNHNQILIFYCTCTLPTSSPVIQLNWLGSVSCLNSMGQVQTQKLIMTSSCRV